MEDETNAEFNNEKKVLCEKIIRDINAVFTKDADLSVNSSISSFIYILYPSDSLFLFLADPRLRSYQRRRTAISRRWCMLITIWDSSRGVPSMCTTTPIAPLSRTAARRSNSSCARCSSSSRAIHLPSISMWRC